MKNRELGGETRRQFVAGGRIVSLSADFVNTKLPTNRAATNQISSNSGKLIKPCMTEHVGLAVIPVTSFKSRVARRDRRLL